MQTMTEPASTAAGGIALYKLGVIGILVGALAAIVVMAMTVPRSAREFIVAIISTLMSSIGGGAFLVRWLEIGHWAQDDIGMVAIGGVLFAAGMPGWVVVRAAFAWAEKRRHLELPELIREARRARDDLQ